MSKPIYAHNFTVDLGKSSYNFCRGDHRKELYGALGDIKLGEEGEYVLHPYGANLTAGELYDLSQLLTELNREID